MNYPGKQSGNWEWRVKIQHLKSEDFEELRRLTKIAMRN
jgi:4-alpha-glucanotransferase